MKTNDLVTRKWRKKSTLGGMKAWETEVGEPDLPSSMAALNLGTELLKESNTNVSIFLHVISGQMASIKSGKKTGKGHVSRV